jgi:cobalt/nickel transport system ATP-binding protein
VSTPALEVRDLTYAYPDGHRALSGCTVRVGRGERVALLGPNGAGKTTFVLHLNGVLSAASGSVRVAGLDISKHNLKEIRRRVGIVFQDPDDQLFMPTVFDDVAFGPRNLGLAEDVTVRRSEAALEAVGMGAFADRPPHHLSLGQRRRVAIATVLAMDPEILVLDEPSSNLDPAGRRELAGIIEGLDLTLLVVSHDLPLALELCPRALLMNDGLIVADRPTRELLADARLMAANSLELPYGFDPAVLAPVEARA